MTSHREDALKVLGRVSAGRAGGSDRPPGSEASASGETESGGSMEKGPCRRR
jgi:hypothetical protein